MSHNPVDVDSLKEENENLKTRLQTVRNQLSCAMDLLEVSRFYEKMMKKNEIEEISNKIRKLETQNVNLKRWLVDIARKEEKIYLDPDALPE